MGRSPIVGSPMALVPRDAGATVSVAHKSSHDADEATFRDLVSKCDILISCAGSPGAIHADWLKEGVIVINVGTTFCETTNALLLDIEGDIESRAASTRRCLAVWGLLAFLCSSVMSQRLLGIKWNVEHPIRGQRSQRHSGKLAIPPRFYPSLDVIT